MAPISIHPLTCPDCGNELVGLPYDRVFYCPPCRKGVHFLGGEARLLSVRFARQGVPGVPDLYLPFWRIRGAVRVENADRMHRVIIDKVKQLPAIWVAGFLTLGRDTFGDLGELFTVKAVSPEEDTDIPRKTRLVGTTRSMSDAIGYAHLHLTDMINRRSDVTGMSLAIDAPTLSLWAMPFSVGRDKLTDLIIEEHIPTAAILDLPEIRATQS